MKKWFKRFVKEESGQSMVEYIIIAALVIIVAIAAWKLLGSKITGNVQKIEKEL